MALGPALLEAAAKAHVPVGAASVFVEQGVVLGALQVAGRVLRTTPASTLRRATSGTGLYFDRGGVLWTLALPSVDFVFKDATASTLLNRNLRLLLAGFAAASIPASYFGREWLSTRHRPIAVAGIDIDPRGTVLLEVFASQSGSFAIPAELASDLERSCDRYRGKAPAGLDEVSPLDPLVLAERVLAGLAERSGGTVAPSPPVAPVAFDPVVKGSLSPLPEGSVLLPCRSIPIGHLDLGRTPARQAFVGGDLLGPVHALGSGVRSLARDLPILGATWDDVAAALESL